MPKNSPIIHVGEIERKLIRENCDRMHISLRELSRRACVGYSTLKNFMNGTTQELTRDNVVVIANSFNMTYRMFCDNEEFDYIQVAPYLNERVKKRKCKK